ncbi:esterase [Cupriavidus sp. UYMMa02A]|nr:esterase [Cupriavidus sp. UYMMa02A]
MAEGDIAAMASSQDATMGAEAVPEGFVAMSKLDGYMGHFGQLYADVPRRTLAVRVGEHHLNNLGIPHGGMLATLADTAIGMMMQIETERKHNAVTVNLSLDYLDAARVGDWLEARVEFDKLGSRLRYGTCRVMSGERCLLRATAIFAVLGPRT